MPKGVMWRQEDVFFADHRRRHRRWREATARAPEDLVERPRRAAAP